MIMRFSCHQVYWHPLIWTSPFFVIQYSELDISSWVNFLLALHPSLFCIFKILPAMASMLLLPSGPSFSCTHCYNFSLLFLIFNLPRIWLSMVWPYFVFCCAYLLLYLGQVFFLWRLAHFSWASVYWGCAEAWMKWDCFSQLVIL